jgi:hypothetical protein
MPRKTRIDSPDARHHVIGPGIAREKIFLSGATRDGTWEHSSNDDILLLLANRGRTVLNYWLMQTKNEVTMSIDHECTPTSITRTAVFGHAPWTGQQ